MFQNAYFQDNPPHLVYNDMKDSLGNDFNTLKIKRWLARSILRKPNEDDTHPTLSQRLASFGKLIPVLSPINETAEGHYLNKDRELYYIHRLSHKWAKEITPNWQRVYENAQTEKGMLKELEEKASHQPLEIDDAYRVAYLVEKFRKSENALALYQNIIAREATHAAAIFSVGRILKDTNDKRGIEYIEEALGLKPEWTIDGCMLIRYFLIDDGKQKEAERDNDRALEYVKILENAREERSIVGNKPYDYIEHGVSQQDIGPIIQFLGQYEEVKESFLVRLKVRYLPGKPFFFLVIVFKASCYR
jgi:hypothetical protein